MAKNIESILIANRGEIASRIIRTCRKMGIKTVAVFSEADRRSPFVEAADLAVFIGESPASESYLEVEKIIAAAKKTKADAIHPGYGFLSENAGFAERCQEEGLIFIGPHPAAIAAMGSKSAAKELMQKNGVPILPGYQGVDQSEARLLKEAKAIGFPLLLKASAGGGGKGMRIVEKLDDLKAAIAAAQGEAKNAFGEEELIIEKYIEAGRHIEFQIFGDQEGNVIHILERECSIQRRYQKVIEESPSPVLTEKLRAEMGAIATKVAQVLRYDNAGTVEFIYEENTRKYYFLEVNTRLQVEHPVTEAITGLDLVQMQIESAQGLPLQIRQEEIKSKGYAIEVRLYAEDASNDFLPVTGMIEQLQWPKMEGLRIETAIRNGSEISIFYDPMIAKLIVWGAERSEAHRKMKYVLRQLVCLGIKSNQGFLLAVLNHKDFQKGLYNTQFIQKKINLGAIGQKEVEANQWAAIAATLYSWQKREQSRALLRAMPSGWRNNFYDFQKETYLHAEEELLVKYVFQKDHFQFLFGEKEYQVCLLSASAGALRLEIDGLQYAFAIAQKKDTYFIHQESLGNFILHQKPRFPDRATQKVKGGFTAPMPAEVIKVLVKKGQKVMAGDGLLVLSSMKMEHTICADEEGEVEAVLVSEGARIDAGFLLLKMVD